MDGAPASGPLRPRPAVNEDNAYFWEGVAQDELRIQRCRACGQLRHPASPGCAACASLEWDFIVSAGHGELYSFVVVHHPLVPPFDSAYVVGLVALDEGPRCVSQVIGISPSEVRIGLRLRVEFVQVDPGLRLPLFRPTSNG